MSRIKNVSVSPPISKSSSTLQTWLKRQIQVSFHRVVAWHCGEHAAEPATLSVDLISGVGSTSGGQLLIALGSLLDDQQWHSVKLERLSAHVNLTVDKNTHQVQVPAELSNWDIHQVSPT